MTPDPIDEVRSRLQTAAAAVDPLADALDIVALAKSGVDVRRTRLAPRAVLVAALGLSLVLVGTLAVWADGGGRHPRLHPTGLPSVRVDLAVTPHGWLPVDYRFAQVSVPKSWIAKIGTEPGSAPGESIMLAPSSSSQLTTFVALHTPANLEPGATKSLINGITVDIGSSSSLALVPAMGVEIDWGGSLGRRVLDTLTWSPEAVALSAGAPASTPGSWQRISFHGVSFAVPPNWTVEHQSDVGACYSPLDLPQIDDVLLNTDQHVDPCSPAGSQESPAGLMGGIVVNLRGNFATSTQSGYVFNSDCHAVPSTGPVLTLCLASDPPPDALLLEATLSRQQPIVFSIGQFGDGTAEREIYDSIAPTSSASDKGTVEPEQPGPMAIGPQGQLYFSDEGLNEVLERLSDGTFRVIAGDGHAGFGGDGGPATKAELREPEGLAIGPGGAIYIADFGNNRVREVLPDGRIETVAGSGSTASLSYPRIEEGPPHVPPTSEPLDGPVSLAFGPHGVLWIALVNGDELAAGTGQVETLSNPPSGAPRSAHLPENGCDPGSIAWSKGILYLGCTDPYKLYELRGGSGWMDLGPFRPHDAFSALTAGRNGTVYGLWQNKVVRLTGTTSATLKVFGSIPYLGSFWPGGIAVASDGTLYLDQASDSGVGASSIISVSQAGIVRTLFTR